MTTEPAGLAGRRRRGKRLLAAAMLALVLATYPVRRAMELSADPVDAKDCPPIEPDTADAAAIRPAYMPAAPAVAWSQRGGTVNDASCLNRTPVHGVVAVRTVEDIEAALHYARANGLRVSVAGVRHSMGGHAFARNAVVLDMMAFNRIAVDAERGSVIVQSGASWHDIQNAIHPRFAVKAMQSTDIFTVGGSISVNAHGMDHRSGSVGRSVRSMRVMLPDGRIETVSRSRNPKLFSLVVGGYGLFGIIVDAELELTPNVVYESMRSIVDYRRFVPELTERIEPDRRVGLLYAHLSTAPGSLLEEMLLYVYREAAAPGVKIPDLGEVRQVRFRRLVFNLSKHGPLAMRLKWFAEKHIEPLIESCTVSRNQAMGEGEACLVSRNDPMHDSVSYLRNSLPAETDILHEYFVPRHRFVAFIDGLREVIRAEDANLLNASVRVVGKEENVLTYAPDDNMLAVVLYLNQPTDRAGRERMASLTGRLIDLSLQAGGRFFLPYQIHYTGAQLEAAYPEIRAFLAARREFDPGGLLSNTFAEKVEALLGAGG